MTAPRLVYPSTLVVVFTHIYQNLWGSSAFAPRWCGDCYLAAPYVSHDSSAACVSISIDRTVFLYLVFYFSINPSYHPARRRLQPFVRTRVASAAPATATVAATLPCSSWRNLESQLACVHARWVGCRAQLPPPIPTMSPMRHVESRSKAMLESVARLLVARNL